MSKPVSKCVKCNIPLPDGVGKYNLNTGQECVSCHDGEDHLIGGKSVSAILVNEYVDKVRQTRRLTNLSGFLGKPENLVRQLHAREDAHKAILKAVNLDYDSSDSDVVEFKAALDKHIEPYVGALGA